VRAHDGAGNKGIAGVENAIIRLYGLVGPVAWTNLAATAVAGSRTIRVNDAVHDGSAGWRWGDRIVIASTSVYLHSEEAVVQSVSPDGKVITLALPLMYTHWGADNEFAEVGLLSRRIVLRGIPFSSSADEMSYGGHVIMKKVKEARIEGCELTAMGQRFIMGRYRTSLGGVRWMQCAVCCGVVCECPLPC
jgi:hypothetical protein